MEDKEVTILYHCCATSCKWWSPVYNCGFRGVELDESGKCKNYFNPDDFVQYASEMSRWSNILESIDKN